MRHKSKNKTRPLFTLSLEMTRLVNETRLLLVPGVNSDINGILTIFITGCTGDENDENIPLTKYTCYTVSAV